MSWTMAAGVMHKGKFTDREMQKGSLLSERGLNTGQDSPAARTEVSP